MWQKIKSYLIIVELQKDLDNVHKMFVEGKINREELERLECTIYDDIMKYIK